MYENGEGESIRGGESDKAGPSLPASLNTGQGRLTGAFFVRWTARSRRWFENSVGASVRGVRDHRCCGVIVENNVNQ